jgi:hypothetical protein
MKLKYYFLLTLLSFFSIQAQSGTSQDYTAVITGFDWGPGVNKVVLRFFNRFRPFNGRKIFKFS